MILPTTDTTLNKGKIRAAGIACARMDGRKTQVAAVAVLAAVLFVVLLAYLPPRDGVVNGTATLVKEPGTTNGVASHFGQYRCRTEQAAGERNGQDRERRAAARKTERESLPDPVLPDPWPHEQVLTEAIESDNQPLVTIRKGAVRVFRDGLCGSKNPILC